MYTFPELLKRLREESNLTQSELAAILGVSTVLVSMIETEQKEVSKGFITRLADKLGVQPASIMPFMFMAKEIAGKDLGAPEKALISIGERLQAYLIKKKAKKLRQYASKEPVS